MLGDEDATLCDEMAGGGAGRFHEGFPVAAGGVGFVARVAGDEFGGFGGADGFVAVAVGGAFGEESEDGLLECGAWGGGFLVAAGVAAELDDVPVLGPLVAVGEGASAGLAEFFFAWGGAVGFGFAVGHDCHSA